MKKTTSQFPSTHPAPPPRILIADECTMCRRGLRSLLAEKGEFKIIAEAGDGETAVKSILDLKPDIAVLDANLPRIRGLEVAALANARSCPTRLVILAHQKDEKLFNQAITLSVRGYLLRRDSEHHVLDCIKSVAAGEAYVSPFLADLLLRRQNRADTLARGLPGLGRLTSAERKILKSIAQGKTSREIASDCGISPRTVDSHRAHICEKLELSGSNRLLQFALEHRDVLNHLD